MIDQERIEALCDMAKQLYEELESIKGESGGEGAVEELAFGEDEYPSSTQKRSSKF